MNNERKGKQNCLLKLYGFRFEFCYGLHVLQYHDDKRTGRTTITVGTWNEEEHKDWSDDERNRAIVYKQGKVGLWLGSTLRPAA